MTNSLETPARFAWDRKSTHLFALWRRLALGLCSIAVLSLYACTDGETAGAPVGAAIMNLRAPVSGCLLVQATSSLRDVSATFQVQGALDEPHTMDALPLTELTLSAKLFSNVTCDGVALYVAPPVKVELSLQMPVARTTLRFVGNGQIAIDGTFEGSARWELVGTGPARAFLGAGYDEKSDRLILFGGDDATSPPNQHRNDVVIVQNASGINGAASWATLAVPGESPPGRIIGATVYDGLRNRLIVHGGCASNCAPALADTWVLSNANGLGGEPRWTRVADAPIARAEFGGAYDEVNRRLIVFGGAQAFPGTARNDVWVMAEDPPGTFTWSELRPLGTAPAPRVYYGGLTYDAASNRLIMYGGFNFVQAPSTTIRYDDVWVLTNANGLGGAPTWIQLQPGGTTPPTRCCESVVFDPVSNRIVVAFGGNGPQNTALDDIWVLTQANGLGGIPQWLEVHPSSGPSPIRRRDHAAAYSVAFDRMIITSGLDSAQPEPWLSDAWVLQGVRGAN